MMLQYKRCGITVLSRSVVNLDIAAGSGTDAQLQRDVHLLLETEAQMVVRETEVPPADFVLLQTHCNSKYV